MWMTSWLFCPGWGRNDDSHTNSRNNCQPQSAPRTSAEIAKKLSSETIPPPLVHFLGEIFSCTGHFPTPHQFLQRAAELDDLLRQLFRATFQQARRDQHRQCPQHDCEV